MGKHIGKYAVRRDFWKSYFGTRIYWKQGEGIVYTGILRGVRFRNGITVLVFSNVLKITGVGIVGRERADKLKSVSLNTVKTIMPLDIDLRFEPKLLFEAIKEVKDSSDLLLSF